MDRVSAIHLSAASGDVRSAVVAAAQGLAVIDQFELVTGARYGIEERAGKAPPPDDDERRTLGPFFFRGRELVLQGAAS